MGRELEITVYALAQIIGFGNLAGRCLVAGLGADFEIVERPGVLRACAACGKREDGKSDGPACSHGN